LILDDPEKPEVGRQQGRSHELLEPLHPCSRLGIHFRQPGLAEAQEIREANIPRATEANIARITSGLCPKAKPSALPRKGAVQGVASKVAKSPGKTIPRSPPARQYDRARSSPIPEE